MYRNYVNQETILIGGSMEQTSNSLISKQNRVLPWGLEKRLEFIEFRLYWEEKINRADLISVFNISIPQASADFSKYQKIAPRNMVYDKNGKFYCASPNFKPVFIKPSSEQYLLRFFAIKSGVLQPQKSFLGFISPVGSVPIPWRRVEPNILKGVLRAIKYKKSIAIEYQSLSRPEKLTRWVSPHALGFDGFRWHCRAYCHIDNFFKDFVLGRIFNIVDERNNEINPDKDLKWNTFVEVKIGPNPKLTEEQRKIIEYEYGMKNGETSIEIRASMLLYLLNQLGVETKIGNKTFQKQYITLLNSEEVQKELD